eukprot:gb/GECG01001090.1/.p1 GENE.gb/GECG01001090.1/~~gb/GECG01001090.1/.p1  ORF type:complete len:220 (+),score=17.34 gb/GECG01001090.1/:1-660(+)
MGFDRYAKLAGILSFMAMFIAGLILVVPSWLEVNHGDGRKDRTGLFHYCVEVDTLGDFSQQDEKCSTVGWIPQSTEDKPPSGTNRLYVEFTASRVSMVLATACLGYIGVRTLCYRIEVRTGYDSYVVFASAILCALTSALMFDLRRNSEALAYMYFYLGAASEPDEDIEKSVQYSICWQVSWAIVLGIIAILYTLYLGKKHLREEVYDAYEHRRLQAVD